ncbi:MAG: transcriptional regulator [Frankiales bacterium]|nr:transcriptional regulator [Frankiales bacterium]
MAEPVEHVSLTAAPADVSRNLPADEGRTRGLVSRALLESGPLTAAALAERLKLSPAAVRRHLDALVTDGSVREVEPRPIPGGSRGRGRPARAYALTDTGRSRFGHAYDDLASHALHYLRETGGEAAVAAFADHRARNLVSRITDKLAADTENRGDEVVALAAALTDEGYAATTEPSAQAGLGVQLCQHHCPVAHVAAEFPELCEAETRALAEVLGTYVQRLATIAHGDGVCTTYIPITQLSHSGRKQ